MREIKFRIFNKTLNKYVYSDEFESKGNKTLNLYFFFKFIEDMKDCDNKFEELEQYTYMKDKNDNEIYEGDIVKLHGYFISEVYFKEGCFLVLTERNGYIDNEIKECEDLLFNVLNICEIIGNIQENRDLLENKS